MSASGLEANVRNRPIADIDFASLGRALRPISRRRAILQNFHIYSFDRTRLARASERQDHPTDHLHRSRQHHSFRRPPSQRESGSGHRAFGRSKIAYPRPRLHLRTTTDTGGPMPLHWRTARSAADSESHQATKRRGMERTQAYYETTRTSSAFHPLRTFGRSV